MSTSCEPDLVRAFTYIFVPGAAFRFFMCLKLLRTHQPYIIWPNHTWECSQATYWTISYPSTVFTSLTQYQTRDCTETAVRAQTPMPPYVPHYYRYFYLCNDALETLECSYLRDWSHIPTIQPTLTSSNCLCEAVSNSAKKKHSAECIHIIMHGRNFVPYHCSSAAWSTDTTHHLKDRHARM